MALDQRFIDELNGVVRRHKRTARRQKKLDTAKPKPPIPAQAGVAFESDRDDGT